VATKAEARARAASWKRAIAEGRVVRFAEGQTFREYSTPEAAQRAAAEAAPELRAKVVRGPEMEHNQAWEGDYVITELDHPGAWNVLYVDRSGNYREILPNLLHDKKVALNFLRDHAREAGAFHAVIFEERAVGDLRQIGNFVEGRLQMTANRTPRLRDGYADELAAHVHWQESSEDDWAEVMLSPGTVRGARYIGASHLGGMPHSIFQLSDGRTVAQLTHMARNAEAPPPPPRRRRTADPSLRRVRAIVEREERPFEPERPYPRETKPHHFVVNAEPFREPDEEVAGYAIWYGPDGAEGDVATEVEREHLGYIVREYHHVEGYIDDYDPDEPFLVTETVVDEDDVPDVDDRMALRYAAAIGVQQMFERGGEESWASELPR
jgi:hypothetical protein